MKLLTALVVILGALFIGVVVASQLRAGRDRELRDQATALRVTVKQTNQSMDLFRLRASQDSITIAKLRGDLVELEEKTNAAEASTLEALALRESARAEVQEGTLSPAVRNLLATERGVATSYLRELNVWKARAAKLDSIVTFETSRADTAVSLLWGVQFERDTALEIIAQHEKRWDFSLSRLLFRDLPRKAACAGGGAAVAAMNKGDVLVGAGVGLLACLMMESLL